MRVTLFVTLALLVVCSIVAASNSNSLQRCMDRCTKKLKISSSSVHCQASCEYKENLQPLEFFVDGQRIEATKSAVESQSDSGYSVNGVNFNSNFYNTPGAFADLLNIQGELLNQLYSSASSRFNTPGVHYAAGTMLHLLPVPIPLSESQFHNQDFMNKLLDIVPSESHEFRPASTVPMSEVYKDFLYNIRVDPSVLQGTPHSPEQQQHIKQVEGNMQIVLGQFMDHAEKCQIAYEQHIAAHKLSPISYTMDSYTPHNQNCMTSNAKLDEYNRLSSQLSDYIASLNSYNQLFAAMGQLRQPNRDWSYSKQDIQQFAEYHRNLEANNIDPAASRYYIPIDIARSHLNSYYFGSGGSVNAQLRFSGLGWKESPVSPQSNWFSLNVLNKYRGNPMNNPKNYFEMNGRLNRVPTHIVVAYKPELRIKISRSMKETFEQRMSTNEYRKPVEGGPFVFTRVDVNTVQGGSVNEEFEMILSTEMKDPQIIGFKSHSIVQVPAYMQYVNRQVNLLTAHGTYVGWPFSIFFPENYIIQTNMMSELYKFTVKNAGEGKVALMSSMGTYLTMQGAQVTMSTAIFAQFTTNIAEAEKFTMVQHGGHWAFRGSDGYYLRALSGGLGARFDGEASMGSWTLFTISVFPEQSYFRFIDRMIVIRTASGQALKGQAGENSVVSTQGSTDPSTVWRMEYYGADRVSFVSTFGTYLKIGPGDYSAPVKSLVVSGTFESGTCAFTLVDAGHGMFNIHAPGFELRKLVLQGNTIVAQQDFQGVVPALPFSFELLE